MGASALKLLTKVLSCASGLVLASWSGRLPASCACELVSLWPPAFVFFFFFFFFFFLSLLLAMTMGSALVLAAGSCTGFLVLAEEP